MRRAFLFVRLERKGAAMHPAEYHNEVSEHFENIFFMPFSWMVGVRPQNISAAHKAGISAQDFALAIGILEGYRIVRKPAGRPVCL